MIGIDLQVKFGNSDEEVRKLAKKYSEAFPRWHIFNTVWRKNTVDSSSFIIILYSFTTG